MPWIALHRAGVEVLVKVPPKRSEEPIGRFMARVEAVLARFKFDGPMPIRFHARIPEAVDGIELRATYRAPDVAEYRRSGEVRIATTYHTWPLEHGSSDEAIESQAIALAWSAWSHEFDEWLTLDGKPVRDPHSDDPK